MNKTEIDFIKRTVRNRVRCINGEIESKLNKLLKPEDISDGEKLKQIREGTARLLSTQDLANIEKGYNTTFLAVVIKCFSYVVPAQILKNKEHNQRLKNRSEELQRQAQKDGEKLITDIVLGVVDPKEINQHLDKISKLVGYLEEVD